MPTLSERTFAAIKLSKSSLRDWAGVGAIGAAYTIAGAGAASLTVSALTFLGLSAATGGAVALAAGAALLTPTVWRVIRPRRREKYHNAELTKKDLDYQFWNCHIFNIGVIGPRGTGKTTIKQLIRGLSTAHLKSTDGKEYHLVRLGSSASKFGVLIDGAGAVDAFGDQANLARESNILIVVFDHFNTRDEQKSDEMCSDQKRLKFHQLFAKNVLDSLSKTGPNDIRRVIFLMTKRDLWMNGPDRATIEQWMEQLKSDIREHHASELPDPLLFKPFDKDNKEDLAWLLDQLQKVI